MQYIDAMTRHLGMITPAQQEMIYASRVAVVGLGSIGSMASLMCSKAGIGNLTICDDSVYITDHIGSQIFATHETVGYNKSIVAEKELQKHNRFCQIDTLQTKIKNNEDAENIVKTADYVITDAHDVRVLLSLSQAAHLNKIPLVVSYSLGWTSLCTIFMPNANSFNEILETFSGFENGKIIDPELFHLEWKIFLLCFGRFDLQSVGKLLENGINENDHMATHACFTASFVVNELIKLIIGKDKVITAPEIFSFDLLTNQQVTLHSYDTERRQVLEAYLQDGLQAAIIAYQNFFEPKGL